MFGAPVFTPNRRRVGPLTSAEGSDPLQCERTGQDTLFSSSQMGSNSHSESLLAQAVPAITRRWNIGIAHDSHRRIHRSPHANVLLWRNLRIQPTPVSVRNADLQQSRESEVSAHSGSSRLTRIRPPKVRTNRPTLCRGLHSCAPESRAGDLPHQSGPQARDLRTFLRRIDFES
jgi:hypothetical protein